MIRAVGTTNGRGGLAVLGLWALLVGTGLVAVIAWHDQPESLIYGLKLLAAGIAIPVAARAATLGAQRLRARAPAKAVGDPDAAARPASARSRSGTAEGRQEELSAREIEVLRLVAAGRTNKEIAEDLVITLGTVKTHTNNIYRKLGARNRVEAVERARGRRLP